MCSKKKLTKIEAQTIINFTRQKARRYMKNRKECRYYQCPRCNWWHLTSKQ